MPDDEALKDITDKITTIIASIKETENFDETIEMKIHQFLKSHYGF